MSQTNTKYLKLKGKNKTKYNMIFFQFKLFTGLTWFDLSLSHRLIILMAAWHLVGSPGPLLRNKPSKSEINNKFIHKI